MPNGCTRAGVDTPIDIGRLQRFVLILNNKLGWKFINPVLKRSQSRHYWRGSCRIAGQCDTDNQGYDVTIYEKEAQAGGWLRTAFRNSGYRNQYWMQKSPVLKNGRDH